jgi:hypothetical protein
MWLLGGGHTCFAMPLFYSDSSDDAVARHLSLLAAKVDEFAQRAGLSVAQRSDLTSTLVGLPWKDRRRLGLLLESTRVSTTNEAALEAVAIMVRLAANIWAATPPEERPASDMNSAESPIDEPQPGMRAG